MPLAAFRFFVRNRAWVADLTRPAELAIPMVFEGAQPRAFGAPAATAAPLRSDAFVGSVAEGGPVNAAVLTLVPHGNGTHTESIAHVTVDGAPVHRVARPGLLPATLMTLVPRNGRFTRAAVEERLCRAEPGFLEAVVVRTAGAADTVRDWDRDPGPSFEEGVLRLLVRSGARHLLVDTPSVDPLRDDGILRAHREFWDLDDGETASTGSVRTITEMIAVPADLDDGPYVLDLQVPCLSTDAVPSRPVLYRTFRDLT